MAPLVKEFKKYPDTFDTIVCITAQHREMLDQVLEFFEIVPDFDLNLMKPNQNLYTLTADIITGMKPILDEVNPDYVFVHGDTTTSTAVALAGFYHGANKVCHIEAGLRTYNKHAPWPEEMNRQITGRIADYHFAPTARSKQNLLEEKVANDTIVVTGNTVIDALLYAVEKVRANPPECLALAHLNLDIHHRGLEGSEQQIAMGAKGQEGSQNCAKGGSLGSSGVSFGEPLSLTLSDFNETPLVLITSHRRENFGQGIENICMAISELAKRLPDVHFVYPVHLNPNVREPISRILGNALNRDRIAEVSSLNSPASNSLSVRSNSTNSTSCTNVHLIEPLDYPSFVWLMDKAKLIITDSGGVQEEAPSLGVPVLVMRDTTERPEAIDAGTVILVGTDVDKIVTEALDLLTNQGRYEGMSRLHNPYGDGFACKRVLDFLTRESTELSN